MSSPNATLDDLLAIVKFAGSKAPSSIVKWGYAALFFAGIAALVFSFVSVDKFQYLIVTVVLVLTLAIALWSLDTFMRSSKPWIRAVANAFAVAMVLAIVSAGGYVTYWAIRIVTTPDVLPLGQAKADVLSASAVRLHWAPVETAQRVLVSVTDEHNGAVRRLESPPGAGSIDISGLSPATRYDFALNAASSWKNSPRSTLSAITHADKLLVPSISTAKYDVQYSGPLNADSRRPLDSMAPVDGTISQTLVGGARWKNGELDGTGVWRDEGSKQRCQITFQAGQPSFDECSLDLSGRKMPERYLGSAARTRYDGSARLADGDAAFGAVKFGPFSLVPAGVGELRDENGYVEVGAFKDGLLQDGYMGEAALAERDRGHFSVKNGDRQGPFMTVGPHAISLGTFANQGLKAGFAIGAMPAREGKLIHLQWEPHGAGKQFGEFYQEREVDTVCDVRDYLNVQQTMVAADLMKWEFPKAEPTLRFGEWSTRCSGRSNDSLICEISSDALTVTAEKTASSAPRLSIVLSSSPNAVQSLSVGDATFTSSSRGRPLTDNAYLAIAGMCKEGQRVENRVNQKTVSTDNFCKAAAAMFARLYFCA